MRSFLLIVFVFSFATIKAQNFSYLIINKEGNSIKDFIPKGWKVLDSAKGDLNNDKKDDLALVLQNKDSITLLEKDDDSIHIDTFITQPRILAIFFYNMSSGKYNLTEQSNSFILNHDKPNMEDPYKSIQIENGVLQIKFEIFDYNASLFMTDLTFKFGYRDNDFKLIGAENYNVDRGTSDYENASFNFLTNKWSMTKGNVLKEVPVKTEWHTLDSKELKTFRTFSKPNTWEIVQSITL
jgi:hypothetical protein